MLDATRCLSYLTIEQRGTVEPELRTAVDFKDVIAGATPQNPNGNCEVVQRARANAAEQRQEDRKEDPAADERESL